MNIVWSFVMLVGLGMLLFGNIDIALSSILDGGSKAISLSLKLWGIYAVWLGILKIVEDTGLDQKLSRLFSPLIRFLIGKTDKYTESQVAINITSNLLGMGRSTPFCPHPYRRRREGNISPHAATFPEGTQGHMTNI